MNTTEKSKSRIYPILMVLLLLVIGALLYMNNTKQVEITDLEDEKEMLRYDLKDYITRYDEIKTDNDSLREVITRERDQLVDLLDSINTLRAGDLVKLRQLQQSIHKYKLENQRLTAVADSLWSANIKLQEEKAQVEAALDEEVERSVGLAQDKAKLSREVSRGAVLQATALQIEALRVRSNGNESSTLRASRTERIKACFTLAANPLTPAGATTIYMRITSDNNQVIVFAKDNNMSKTFSFNGSPLMYSASKDILYENSMMTDCIAFDIPSGEKLAKGVYKIELYTETYKLTEGNIELN
jgi:hypothetical protein